ncbi:MAG TPA: hypothetical protein VGQ36_21175, partial [Thermoanaerobaculia bacterium]|nr:hypothetical protein [Thermoanaerobaculia bacterium]
MPRIRKRRHEAGQVKWTDLVGIDLRYHQHCGSELLGFGQRFGRVVAAVGQRLVGRPAGVLDHLLEHRSELPLIVFLVHHVRGHH